MPPARSTPQLAEPFSVVSRYDFDGASSIKTLLRLCLLMAVLGSGTASGQQHQHAPPPCQGANLSCARAATPTFGTEGDLWLAWSAGGRVSVGHSRDLGHSFETNTAVNPEPERIDTGPDARPKIVVNKNAIVVAYAVFQDDHYNGRVMVTRSVDGGASLTAPRPITDDATSQRFETLTADPDGNIFAAWLDKRNLAAMRRAGGTYSGAALAYSWSMDADPHRAGQCLRMLPSRRRLCGCASAGCPLPQHLRHQHARSPSWCFKIAILQGRSTG
jgi:hypothetical protein